MRRVLVVLLGLVVLLIAALVAIPFLFKDKLVAAAMGEVNKRLDATVAFDGADVTLLSSFPDLRLAVDGLVITNRAPFDGAELARVGELRVDLDVMKALSGTYEVHSLQVKDGAFHVIIDEDGRENYDIGPAGEEPAPDSDEESSALALSLEDYALEGVGLVYDDRQGGTRLEIAGMDHRGELGVAGAAVHLDSTTDIAAISLLSGGVGLLRDAKLQSDLALDYDTDTGRIALGDNRLQLNGLGLTFSGTVEPQGADMALDLKVAAEQTTFASVLSLIPAVYKSGMEGMDAAGTLALQAAVHGVLASEGDDLPAFDLALQVAEGRFQLADVPQSVEDIALDVAIEHPGGPADLIAVDVNRFHLAVAGAPLDGTLKLRHPTTDPDIALALKGDIDLAQLHAAVPVEGTDYKGRLSADMLVAGRVSQFQGVNLDAVTAKGFFRLTDFLYTSADLPEDVTITRLDLTIDPRRVDMADFTARFGASDLHATGQIENTLGWLLLDETLAGKMTLTSKLLDLRPWTADDSEDDGASDAVTLIPTNLDLRLDASLAQVLYDTYDLRDVTGTVIVKDGVVRMDPLKMKTLGGGVELKGTYATPSVTAADVDVEVTLKDFPVSETVAAFATIETIAPVARGAAGRFSTGFTVQTTLGPDYSPDMSSLQSDGRLQTFEVELSPSFLGKLASQLKKDQMKTLRLTDADLGFAIRNGRVVLDRFPVKLGSVAASLQGSTGIEDESLDLQLGFALPASDLQGSEALTALGLASDAGVVDLLALIGGTYDKPTVKLDLGSLTGKLMDTVKAEVMERVEEVKTQVTERATEELSKLIDDAKLRGDQLVSEAEKAGDKLRSEAKKGADKLRNEAEKQGDRLIADAGGNPIKEAAAKEAKKGLVKEADKKAARLEKEADDKATAGVTKAKTERDRLVSEAEAKVAAGK